VLADVAPVGLVDAANRVKRREIDESLLRLTEVDSAARDLAMLERLGGRLLIAADAECRPLPSDRRTRIDRDGVAAGPEAEQERQITDVLWKAAESGFSGPAFIFFMTTSARC
jgi:hypothetical protein